mgnify:CR=1 FL=1
MPKKILFVLHEDSQTGAPNALLSFLKYINAHYKNEFVIDIYVLNYFGGIEKELKQICRNYYINKKKKTVFGKIAKLFCANINSILKQKKYDLVYGNTIVTLNLLSSLKQHNNKVKTLLYVHESKFLTNIYLDKQKASNQFKNINHVFAVSQAAVNNLVENYNVPQDKCTIIYPTIPEESFSKDPHFVNNFITNELALVTIGHPNLTKGTDLLPQIAHRLKQKNPSLQFKIYIVGVLQNNEYLKAVQLDIDKLGLKNYFELIPHTQTPLNYLDVANIYLIPSREDAFSLMAMHAAKFQKPIVMFKNAVGAAEVLNEDCIFYANYLDINDFATQIETIYNNPESAKQKTTNALEAYNENLQAAKSNQLHYQILKSILNN